MYHLSPSAHCKVARKYVAFVSRRIRQFNLHKMVFKYVAFLALLAKGKKIGKSQAPSLRNLRTKCDDGGTDIACFQLHFALNSYFFVFPFKS